MADIDYRPQMSTGDVLSLENLVVGGGRHVQLLDLIDALRSEEEEDMLRMLLNGWSQEKVGEDLGIDQATVSRRLKRLVQRANEPRIAGPSQ